MINGTAKRRNGETARKPIRHFRDLEVYQNALATGLRVYELSKKFPPEEKYFLTDQSGALRDQFAPTLPRHGRSGAMKQHLFRNSAMPKVKPRKRRFIWNSRFTIATFLA